LRDIREFGDDPAAYAEELRRRWGALLSYRYVGRRFAGMDAGPVDDTVVLRRDLRDPAGGILLAVLGICAPEGGGRTDLEAVPNPVVHSCQVIDPGVDVARIRIESEVLKVGRQFGYSRSRIVDADQPDRVLALSEGQGVSLGTPPLGLAEMQTEPIELVDSDDLPPLWQVFGAEHIAVGQWELPELSVELASPDAALHLGPQLVVLETAARDLAVEVADTDLLAGVSSHTMFLARGKSGPFRTSGECFADPAGTIGVRMRLVDLGEASRPVTASSYLFQSRSRVD
jgi:hypothetical protein